MKSVISFLAIGVLVVNSSCSPLEDPSVVPPEEVLQLSVIGKMQLIANGKDQTALIARVPKEAGLVSVTFTASAGSFAYNNTKSIKQLLDSVQGEYRYTRTVFRSDNTTQGIVYVTAETVQATRRQTLVFTP